MKIVVFSDIHFSPFAPSNGERRQRLGDILLLRLVRRIRNHIRPDAVLVAGDIVDSPSDTESLKLCKEYLDIIQAPKIVIRGNHDPAQDVFDSIFGVTPEHIDIGKTRIVPFNDAERENYNAERSQNDIERLKKHCSEFDGNVITFQHLPLFEKGVSESPYSILNAEECIECAPALSIGGHFHKGFINLDGTTFPSVCAPALCESPFRYIIIEIDDTTGAVKAHFEQLKLPFDGITDYHIHTRNAYCQENMDIERTFEFAQAFGLERFAFTEHSGQLYVSGNDYWSGNFDLHTFRSTPISDRTKDYFDLLDDMKSKFNFIRGLELDSASDGSILARNEDIEKISFRLGAIHWLTPDADTLELMKEEFMFRCESLMKYGCHALAHPFRIFQRKGIAAPEDLFEPLADLLKRHNCAAEINFHTNKPEKTFFECCASKGVKISLGSDSHNLYEIGEFYPHLKMLEEIGVKPSELYTF